LVRVYAELILQNTLTCVLITSVITIMRFINWLGHRVIFQKCQYRHRGQWWVKVSDKVGTGVSSSLSVICMLLMFLNISNVLRLFAIVRQISTPTSDLWTTIYTTLA